MTLIWLAQLALLAPLSGCTPESPYEGAFNFPHARAVLQTTDGPFSEPIAYIANHDDGKITMLSLKQGRLTVDQPTASFARAAPLAAGQNRIIGDLASWAPDNEHTYVFATDQRYGQLLRLTHVASVDEQGHPVRLALATTEPVATGSGSAVLSGLTFTEGYVSTEDWRIERSDQEAVWWVTGTRSGRLADPAIVGEPFISPRKIISFTIDTDGVSGDAFSFSTDTGLIEYDLGGIPLQISTAPDQSRLAVVVRNPTLDLTALKWFDPVAETATDLTLGDNSMPGRMTWSDGNLYVSDAGRPAFWKIEADSTVTEFPLPWPTTDIAILNDGEGGGRFYVSPDTGRSVWMGDLATGELIDINPYTAAIDGLNFAAPIAGIDAITMAHNLVERDDFDTPLVARTVAVATKDGTVRFIKENGCLSMDAIGPRTDSTSTQSQTVDYTTDIDGFTLDGRFPFLQQNDANSRHVQVHSCGGVAQDEIWLLTYRRNAQAWQVEGSISGKQANYAYEDQRYVSDEGEVSFLMRAGGLPSEEGWRMSFKANPGVVVSNGEAIDAAQSISLSSPGDPLFFHYLAGTSPTARPYLLVVAEGADIVTRINPTHGAVEVDWW